MAEIVGGVDGSPASQDALVWALGQAGATGASVRVVHVATPRSVRQREAEAELSAKEVRARAERLLDDAIAAAGPPVVVIPPPDGRM